jgi:hypothetical protein
MPNLLEFGFAVRVFCLIRRHGEVVEGGGLQGVFAFLLLKHFFLFSSSAFFFSGEVVWGW